MRSRSKYVVIFFSDGVPDPQCIAGLPPAMQPRAVCQFDRAEWPDQFQLPGGNNPNTGAPWTWDDFQGLYPDLDLGKDYNSTGQITRIARHFKAQVVDNLLAILGGGGALDPRLVPVIGLSAEEHADADDAEIDRDREPIVVGHMVAHAM